MKRILAALLALTFCLGLIACAAAAEQPITDEPVSVMVLNGPTGFGMAKLMADADAGRTALDYDFSVESDASVVSAALINGDCDIAALPTNAASTLYNRSGGGVRLLALNTKGVLYLVVNSKAVTVDSLEDLAGMTVYVPAQNPMFQVMALCGAAGVDVTLDDSYAQPADLRTALAAGEVDLAVLPEPMVTIACAANEDLAVALDLTEQWAAAFPDCSPVQGCVVVRSDFAEAYPDAVEAFLAEYGPSIAYLTEEPAEASALIEQTGVFSNAAIAEKAIPRCNVCFITGADMRGEMEQFLQTLYDVSPESIGGSLPDEDFYYVG